MTTEQRIYESQKIMDWLIDSYFTNLILKNKLKEGITAEWIVKNYNVEMEYFRPWTKKTQNEIWQNNLEKKYPYAYSTIPSFMWTWIYDNLVKKQI